MSTLLTIIQTEEIIKIAEALGTTVGALMGEGEPQETPQINLPINDAPENKIPNDDLGLGYWGNVADNARRIAKIGSEQDKAAALMMLRMATDAITGAGAAGTGGGTQGANIHADIIDNNGNVKQTISTVH